MKYLGAASSMDLAPHIYALGLNAVKGLQQYGGTSQAVQKASKIHRYPSKLMKTEPFSMFLAFKP